MMRRLGEQVGDAIVESVGRAVGRSQEQRPLPADLLESDDAYLAVFDAPGVAAGDAQVRFEAGRVVVRVDRFRDFREGFEMRFPGRGLTLEGSVALPDEAAVDPNGATATLKKNGTLQVEIPKVADGSDVDVVEEESETAEADTEDDADAEHGAEGDSPEDEAGAESDETGTDDS